MTDDSRSISVGVIGTGGMGGRHTRNLHTKVVGAKVVAVMDLDLTRAEEIAVECGSPQVFRDAHKLIRDEGIEAVVIASPDDTHAGLVLECLRWNKPVFCEKPLATALTDAQKIINAETDLGRKLVQVGFVRRFDNQHLRLKQVIDSGAIGRPVLYRGWHRNVGIGGYGISSEVLLNNAASHDLDSVQWLLGQEIEEVFVKGTNTDKALGEEPFDLQLLQLSLSGGCLATIEVYLTATYGYEVGVEVVGERGTVLIGPPQGPIVRSDRTYAVHVEADWLERFESGYVSEMEAWIESLRGKNHAGPDSWDGYISVLAAEGCITSLRSGAPYRLPSSKRPLLYGEVKR